MYSSEKEISYDTLIQKYIEELNNFEKKGMRCNTIRTNISIYFKIIVHYGVYN